MYVVPVCLFHCNRPWSKAERKHLAELVTQRTKSSTNRQYAPYLRLWKVGRTVVLLLLLVPVLLSLMSCLCGTSVSYK